MISRAIASGELRTSAPLDYNVSDASARRCLPLPQPIEEAFTFSTEITLLKQFKKDVYKIH